MLFINGILATQEDIELFKHNIMVKDLTFEVKYDSCGFQHIYTND